MEIQSGHSELSVISQVSAIEVCPLGGVPLYLITTESKFATGDIITTSLVPHEKYCTLPIMDFGFRHINKLCMLRIEYYWGASLSRLTQT